MARFNMSVVSGRAIVATITIAAIAGCGVDSAARHNDTPETIIVKGKCEIDLDCAEGLTCDIAGGYCLKTVETVVKQDVLVDCRTPGHQCSEGVCRETDGLCYTKETVYGACTEDVQCTGSRVCDQDGFCVVDSTPDPTPVPGDTCSATLALTVGNDSTWSVETYYSSESPENMTVGRFSITPGTFGAHLGRLEFKIEGALTALSDQFFFVYNEAGEQIGMNVSVAQGTVAIPFTSRYEVPRTSPPTPQWFTLRLHQVPPGTNNLLRLRLDKVEYVTGWGDPCTQTGPYQNLVWDTNLAP